MTPQITLTIDDVEVTVPRGATVMDACKAAEKEIPHFCYHERLSVAGNCRMCLVEIEGAPKPVASCHWPAADGMKVRTKGTVTEEARKGTMGFLLANHPLDCPICDQAGECDLQDQAVAYGSDVSHFHEAKRAVDDKEIGEKIKTVMTRCIHCTRCVRFATEIAGIQEFGGTGRGENLQIGTYVEKALQSELAGNMIDLCPVGALTSKPYAFSARPWELKVSSSIDMTDPVGTNINIHTRSGQVMRIVPRENAEVNEEWMTDAGRFSYDAMTHNRLSSPMMKKGRSNKLETASWQDAFTKFKTVAKKAKSAKIAGVMGDMHTAEDAYAFSTFMRTVLKSDNIDCRHDGVMISAQNHAGYIMNTSLEQLETADAVLLVGCDTRQVPLVNTRLRKAFKNGAKIANIGCEELDLTYPFEQISNHPSAIEMLLDKKHAFSKVLETAERPVLIVGNEALKRKDAQHILFMSALLADQFGLISTEWNGFNVLLSKAGVVNGLDMSVVPQSGGMDIGKIKTALKDHKIDLFVQYGDLDVDSALLTNADFRVYIGTHMTEQALSADMMLPVALYSEKAGLTANIEGRVQMFSAVVQPPLNAKEDWKVFRALSEVMGNKLPFDTLGELRDLIVAHCSAYAQIGKRIPALWKGVGKVSKFNAADFEHTRSPFYLSNAYLRQSPLMHKMQKESDLLKDNHQVEAA